MKHLQEREQKSTLWKEWLTALEENSNSSTNASLDLRAASLTTKASIRVELRATIKHQLQDRKPL